MLADVRPVPPVLPAITGERFRKGYSVARSAGRTDCSDCSPRYGETLLRRRSLSATSRYLPADYELRPPRLSRNHFAPVSRRRRRRVEIERPLLEPRSSQHRQEGPLDVALIRGLLSPRAHSSLALRSTRLCRVFLAQPRVFLYRSIYRSSRAS